MRVSHHPCRFVAPRMKNIRVALMSRIWLNCSDGWEAFEGGFSSSVLTFLALPPTSVATPPPHQRVNDSEGGGGCLCVHGAPSQTVARGGIFFVCVFFLNSLPVFRRPATATQVQGLCGNKPELEGVDSSFYLPISPWILLHYWQTDSRALWADRSPLSAGYHFQLNPFI